MYRGQEGMRPSQGVSDESVQAKFGFLKEERINLGLQLIRKAGCMLYYGLFSHLEMVLSVS